MKSLITIVILYCLNAIYADDFIGCGGFVKSAVDIKYSQIEMKLYSKQGILKYKTECAPINGYYMIPIYDKGEYLLKVSPPGGWAFKPDSVELKIDGSTDKCSLGQDIDFHFTGFGVIGKVVSEGGSNGPAGIKVTLTPTTLKLADKFTTTSEDGSYEFLNVLPGEYTVVASHSRWLFSTSKATVTVAEKTGDAGNKLSLYGFDVKGKVTSNTERIQGVHLLLFSSKPQNKAQKHCKLDNPSTISVPGQSFICHVLSEADGSFVFPAVANGDYTLVPYHKYKQISFDINPRQKTFTVLDDTTNLDEQFMVTGFSVKGQILMAPKGQGLAKVDVLINGRMVATTDTKGFYTLPSVTTGRYRLDVDAPNVEFDTTDIAVSIDNPQLSDISPSRYEVCGRVVIDKVPEKFTSKTIVEVVSAIDKSGAKPATQIKVNSDSGKFCHQLAPATYTFKAIIGDEFKAAGVSLSPAHRDIVVKNKPIDGVLFSQFRAAVSGTVNCIEKCGDMQVVLNLDGDSQKYSVKISSQQKSAFFKFVEVMPASYKLAVIRDNWCFQSESTPVEITLSDVSNLNIKQSGFKMHYDLSHDLEMTIKHSSPQSKAYKRQLAQGTGHLCLDRPGDYSLTVESCSRVFQLSEYKYSTYQSAGQDSPLVVVATKHNVIGEIFTSQADQIVINIKDGDHSEDIGPLKGIKKSDSNFVYEFSYLTSNQGSIQVTPKSKLLLFNHVISHVQIDTNACPGARVRLLGRTGQFVSGSVTPAIAGVEVTVKATEGQEVIQLMTTSDGKYSVGPLEPNTYTTTAVKDGYVIQAVEGKPGSFTAFKLADIQAIVVDEAGNTLSGVLLSLSGGVGYRSNSLSDVNGKKSFLNLSPGEYFLRTMMKEYEFTPSSSSISLKQGATEIIRIRGKQTAYSVYGNVSSVNGSPEGGVFVEASSDSSCSNHQEASETEQDGSFRIRGLMPNCKYHLKLSAGEVNKQFERHYPKDFMIQIVNKDIRDANMIAYRMYKAMDVSVSVNTNEQYYQNIKVNIYEEENQAYPKHSLQLNQANGNFLNLPEMIIDAKVYIIEVKCNLQTSIYRYKNQQIKFTANKSYHHFNFDFTIKMNNIENDINMSSFLILPFTIFLLLLTYNYQSIVQTLKEYKKTGRISNSSNISSNVSSNMMSSFSKPETSNLKTRKQKLAKA